MDGPDNLAGLELGQGDWRFTPAPAWGTALPAEIQLGDVAAIAVDRNDRVFLFNRGSHPMVILDRHGTFLDAWGTGVFKNPHGLHIGPDDALYCTDDGDHTVRKCTMQGQILLQLGTPATPAPAMSGQPFCRCCHTALSPEGDIYVADGYGNARIHVYAPDGRPLFGWGQPGTEPGQFNLPHNICCDDDGWIYVADRENHRIQVFDRKGRYETQLNNLHRPSALMLFGRTCPVCIVGEVGPYMNVNRRTPNLGPRISIMAHDGTLLSRIGVTPAAGQGPGQFYSPHGIAMDSQGDLYVGEVSSRAWPSLFPDTPPPNPLRRMQKLLRVRATPGAV
ncbi:peptidyl-alpha-hydroxyglycine alpha-amidating lyase family protein [Acidisphaera sp. L21]|uniref:peptidyl-alpha-hydroxyglycine alpha-amidating lyase family protein n=1 Tax=Acidisphaera sp. L21 TaxID=1641851 RepID=UPI00131CF2F1|nr:peptidyl-alpha-hydroxyglycine alpha-amidating lyase family protein [Acidisphaera sp. L21]